MATSNYYINLASRHQVYLERLKAGYLNSYQATIRKLDKAISEIIQALDVDTLDELTQKRLNTLLKDLRKAQLGVYVAHTEKLVTELEELSNSESEFEETALKKATVSAKIIKTSAGVWSGTLEQPIQATGELLQPFLAELTARNISRVEREIRISVSQGRTISQTVKAVRGTKKNNYRDGVLGRNWTDARTVIRTATQHVSTQARMATWKSNSDIIDGYQWVSTLDGVTSDRCRSLDTQVFEIGRGPLPPIHPNCRSTTIPYFKDDVELWSSGATRSAEFGPVSAKTSYYEWLKQQPKAFQNDAIGVTRAKLLRDGGLSAKEFASLQLDKNFEPLTLEEMRKLNPNAFDKAEI